LDYGDPFCTRRQCGVTDQPLKPRRVPAAAALRFDFLRSRVMCSIRAPSPLVGVTLRSGAERGGRALKRERTRARESEKDGEKGGSEKDSAWKKGGVIRRARARLHQHMQHGAHV